MNLNLAIPAIIGRSPAQEFARLNESELKLVERLRNTQAKLEAVHIDAAEENFDRNADEVVRLQATKTTVEHSLRNLRERRLTILTTIGQQRANELDRQADRAEAEVSRIRREAKAAFERFVEIEGIELMSTEYETLFRCKSTALSIEASSIRRRAQDLRNSPYADSGTVQIDENATLGELIERVQASETDRPSIQTVAGWWDRSLSAIDAQPGGFTFSGCVRIAWRFGQIDTAASFMRAARERDERHERIEVHGQAA